MLAHDIVLRRLKARIVKLIAVNPNRIVHNSAPTQIIEVRKEFILCVKTWRTIKNSVTRIRGSKIAEFFKLSLPDCPILSFSSPIIDIKSIVSSKRIGDIGFLF